MIASHVIPRASPLLAPSLFHPAIDQPCLPKKTQPPLDPAPLARTPLFHLRCQSLPTVSGQKSAHFPRLSSRDSVLVAPPPLRVRSIRVSLARRLVQRIPPSATHTEVGGDDVEEEARQEDIQQPALITLALSPSAPEYPAMYSKTIGAEQAHKEHILAVNRDFIAQPRLSKSPSPLSPSSPPRAAAPRPRRSRLRGRAFRLVLDRPRPGSAPTTRGTGRGGRGERGPRRHFSRECRKIHHGVGVASAVSIP